jgi:predicted ATP-dependent endonuclease of OLD family
MMVKNLEGIELVRKSFKGNNQDLFNWSQFEQLALHQTRSLSLGTERGMSKQRIQVDPQTIEVFLRNFDLNMTLEHEHEHERFTMLGGFLGSIVSSRFATQLAAQLQKIINTQKDPQNPINPEIPHLQRQNIQIENIEALLSQRYRSARHTASKKIQSALFDTLSAAIDINSQPAQQNAQTPEDFATRLLENRQRIIEALDDEEQNHFKSQIVGILNAIDQPGELEKVQAQPLLLKLFTNIISELEVEKLALSAINLLVDTFNRYLIDNKKLIVNRTEVFVKTDDGRHSVNELSSGERHILTFLVLVLFEGENRDFLIIDEPEISLNIKWQRELMGFFAKLLPDTQIIVASHAPALAKRHPEFLAKLNVFRG